MMSCISVTSPIFTCTRLTSWPATLLTGLPSQLRQLTRLANLLSTILYDVLQFKFIISLFRLRRVAISSIYVRESKFLPGVNIQVQVCKNVSTISRPKLFLACSSELVS